MTLIQTQRQTRPDQYRALLFICMLFMFIIWLPWIHPATDQHPTCIATNFSHCYMATALTLYTPMTHAISVAGGAGRLLHKRENVQEFDSKSRVQKLHRFTGELEVMIGDMLQVTGVQKFTHRAVI